MLVNIRFSKYHIWKPLRRPQKSDSFNNNFALASRFFVPFFAVAARLIRRKCAEFPGGRNTRQRLSSSVFFLFLNFDANFRIQPLKNLQTFDDLKEMG